jgi:tRNA dimethylallyltransferase
MLAQGLLEEVWALMQRSDLHPDLPALRCVGYRQCWQALQEVNAGPGDKAPTLSPAQFQALRSSGIAATRQLAKRQITWLRSMPSRCVVQADAPQAVALSVTALAKTWMSA